ncbi:MULTISPECIES: hypothetical protein [unclassified Streptomyces]|uniref:hypothetical protein n=1 Tax=unclassified Streptomyces TaxID=2593676 RepID=UPI002DD7F019|nr:hypothetical protein [Streptomyces sp. NBC_01445]WSE09977.1 hypothetical protein OG574_45570 [Streptomyces sp. NBC_01445]
MPASPLHPAQPQRRNALRAVRDGGRFVGVKPASRPPQERGIAVEVGFAHPDGALLSRLLARVTTGERPARVHTVAQFDEAAGACQAMDKRGDHGRIVLVP